LRFHIKIQILKTANEDFDTTPEIMEAMRKDIWEYLRSHEEHYEACGNKEKVSINHHGGNETLTISSFLDIGAGDGRQGTRSV
jgi:hypothetical protein